MIVYLQDGRRHFGSQLSIDLKKTLKKAHLLKDFRFTDIKEKWGYLTFSTNFTTDGIEDILAKYEYMSIQYCFNCGKPVRYVSDSYIMYTCENCYYHYSNNTKNSINDRLKETSIPLSDSECKHFGIQNFHDAWGLNKKEDD